MAAGPRSDLSHHAASRTWWGGWWWWGRPRGDLRLADLPIAPLYRRAAMGKARERAVLLTPPSCSYQSSPARRRLTTRSDGDCPALRAERLLLTDRSGQNAFFFFSFRTRRIWRPVGPPAWKAATPVGAKTFAAPSGPKRLLANAVRSWITNDFLVPATPVVRRRSFF